MTNDNSNKPFDKITKGAFSRGYASFLITDHEKMSSSSTHLWRFCLFCLKLIYWYNEAFFLILEIRKRSIVIPQSTANNVVEKLTGFGDKVKEKIDVLFGKIMEYEHKLDSLTNRTIDSIVSMQSSVISIF